MKEKILKCSVFVILSFTCITLTAQTTDPLRLMKKFLGAWQANRGKDTVEVWDFKPYGSQAFIVDIYRLVNGEKTPVSFNPISYDPATGKFYGFTLLASGNYGTWTGSFTSDTEFNGDMLANFSPQPVYGRLQNNFINPDEWTWKGYNPDGKKFLQLDFVRVK